MWLAHKRTDLLQGGTQNVRVRAGVTACMIVRGYICEETFHEAMVLAEGSGVMPPSRSFETPLLVTIGPHRGLKADTGTPIDCMDILKTTMMPTEKQYELLPRREDKEELGYAQQRGSRRSS